MLIVQKADRSDASALSQLAEITFRDTFGAVNTAENLELHCRKNYSEAIQTGEIVSPDMVTLLAKEDCRLVGFAQLRWGAAPDCVTGKAPGEIQRLYVAQEFHGKGVAQTLMKACLAEVASRGSGVVWLGVWEQNPRAISFYKKFGFVEVGAHTFPLGTDPQRDIVMARTAESPQ